MSKNILFMIGNGFDINLKLKTRFSDVAEEYLNVYSNTSDVNIQKFKEELKKYPEKWSDFEKQMGEYTYSGGFNLETKGIYLDQIRSFISVLIEKFKREEMRVDYNSHKEHIFDVFKNSLTSFDKYLDEKSKSAISPIISPSFSNLEFCYDFITFNYTNVLDRCIEIFNEKQEGIFLRTYAHHNINDTVGKVLHIHGTLYENLILGVDNPNQIVNEELAKDEEFRWEIVKTKINEELGENYDSNARTMIDNSSIICFFGISIGETDKTWWKYIFSWLKVDSSRHLILFHYKEPDDEVFPTPKIKHKNVVINLFLDIVGSTNEIERRILKSQVHIAQNNGEMFKLDILSGSDELKTLDIF